MFVDQFRATPGIFPRRRCGGTDENLYLAIRKHAEKTEAETAAEIPESRVVFSPLAAPGHSGGEPDFIAGGSTVDTLEDKLEIEGELELPDDDEGRAVSLDGKDITAADLAFDGEPKSLEEAFDRAIKRGFQGLGSNKRSNVPEGIRRFGIPSRAPIGAVQEVRSTPHCCGDIYRVVGFYTVAFERSFCMPVKAEVDNSFSDQSKSRRAKARDQKREAVLRAALHMFGAHGFHTTSLDEVAASLNISKPTIYYYLGNKDQVLFECVSRGLGFLKEAAENAQTIKGTGLERLRAFMRRYLEINMSDYGRCVARTDDKSLSPETAKQYRLLKRRIDEVMRDLIRDGIADGSIADGDVRLIAFTLAGALNWPATWYNPNGPESSERLAIKMTDILTEGIARR